MAIHDPKAAGTDAWIDIVNSDGSMAQACGNGTRCVVQALAAETGKKAFLFHTVAGLLEAKEHDDGTISVDMGSPRFGWNEIPLSEEFHDTRRIELQIGPIDNPVLHSPSVASMGNPHAIFWVDNDVWSYDLERFGPLLENHPMFPERANISIARVLSRQRTGPQNLGTRRRPDACLRFCRLCRRRQRRPDRPHRPQGDRQRARRPAVDRVARSGRPCRHDRPGRMGMVGNRRSCDRRLAAR